MEPLATLLCDEFLRRKERNPSFSKRAFSRTLGISSGALVELMTGQRRPSRYLAAKLCGKMGRHPAELGVSMPAAPALNVLPLDQFELICRLEHYHVLSLLRLEQPPRTTARIAAALGISEFRATTVLARLERLGLVACNERKGWRRTACSLATPPGVSSAAIRQAHREALALAATALDLPLSERDFALQFHVGAPEQMPMVRKILREFQDKLDAVFAEGPKTQVFQLNVQFFPVTKARRDP